MYTYSVSFLINFRFFLAGSLVVGFEYSAEVAYPEPEATALAFLNAVILFFGLIFSIAIDFLSDVIGYFYVNIIIAGMLCLCSFVVLLLSPRLRRLEMNQILMAGGAE